MKLHGTSQTRESKYNATVGFIISLGLLMFVFVGFEFSSMPPAGKLFMIVWVFGVCAQGYQAYRNSIFSNRNLHHEVTDHNLKVSGLSQLKPKPTPAAAPKTHAFRLREVEQLYREGLLTTEEYEAKRADIMDEDWGKL